MNPNTAKGVDQYFITKRFNHQLQSEWQIANDLKLSSAASFQDYQRNTETYLIDYRIQNKTVKDDAGGSWDRTKFSTIFFRTTAQWRMSPLISVQPGFEIKRDKTSGQRILAGAPAITDYSLFASAE